ncbi:DUF4238 domain-containing protein [Bacteroides sp.]|uniref:DUF4238 domain-containing protein n=1 Tax=Bacteroides sp. TaxID=29523 RepID=UPI00261C461B|nr:DUF4238 domain-containing protein [Bacteroides sp.]MDD3041067.1 DUF4238 domain-containing protein [Bacteroides sp.]
MVKSHTQIPKFLLKGFSHKTKDGQKVFYLDLDDLLVKEGKINQLGTVVGFYNKEIEDFLNKNVERPFADLLVEFNEYAKEKRKPLTISRKDNDIIRRFMRYCLLRSDYFLAQVNTQSKLSFLVGGYTHNDVLAHVDFFSSNDFLENYNATILINHSDIEFVTLKNCYISAMVEGKQPKYIIPINRKIAIMLISNSENIGVKDTYEITPHIVVSDDVMKSINARALFNEIQYSGKFLVCSREKELEELVDLIAEKNVKGEELLPIT